MPSKTNPGLELEHNTLICHNPDLIAKAGDILLHDDKIDLVVIRGLVAITDLDMLLVGAKEDEGETIPDVAQLYELVPQLRDLDVVVADFWRDHGYSDFSLTEPSMSGTKVSHGGMGPHTDYFFYETELEEISLVGPLSLSVALNAYRGLYQVEKPKVDNRDGEGNFVYELWKAMKYREGPPALRSQEWQYEGDGVLFMNHPRQSFHAVTADSNRNAALYDYTVAHESALNAAQVENPTQERTA